MAMPIWVVPQQPAIAIFVATLATVLALAAPARAGMEEDRSAFAAFSQTENFRRVAGLPAVNMAIEIKYDPAADDGATREALAALAAEDARAAADLADSVITRRRQQPQSPAWAFQVVK